ncbi:hypothetical protein LY78DRAFT_660270 [Colletotrichum sublineola]|nr:hypothetical protein LY78DRAFT_660270 [Colletotrichum sublineola]
MPDTLRCPPIVPFPLRSHRETATPPSGRKGQGQQDNGPLITHSSDHRRPIMRRILP